MKLTKLQKEEILICLWNRQEAIEEDIDSATEFEAITGNLEALEQKIKSGSTDFSEDQKQWLKEEFENLADIGTSNISSSSSDKEERQIIGFINSMNNAINKI